MKLRQFTFIALSLVAGIFSIQSGAYAQDPGNKKQMQQLAYDYCAKTGKADVCNCFAENLVNNFGEKEWKLFIADATNGQYASDVSQGDMDAYGNKLAAAGRACGVR